jgi:hypothetical protein
VALLVNDGGHLEYPDTHCPREDITSVTILIKHRSITSDPVRVQLMDITRASDGFGSSADRILKEPKQHRGHTMVPEKVHVLVAIKSCPLLAKTQYIQNIVSVTW